MAINDSSLQPVAKTGELGITALWMDGVGNITRCAACSSTGDQVDHRADQTRAV